MIVFLDIDGVLANFNKGAFEALDIEYDYHHPALNEWHWYKYFGISFARVNTVCDIDFWANLEWMHDGKQIFDAVENRFYSLKQTNHPYPASLKPDNEIYLLTAPMPHPGSGTGKLLWIEKHLPRYVGHTIITTAPKSLLAGPDRLLIDDKDENIVDFVGHGGEGILVPRPWNELHGWADDTLQVVKNSLEAV